jgi:Fe-S-cluster-containing dehydrogenase component
MDRRSFFKFLGLAGGTSMVGKDLLAAPRPAADNGASPAAHRGEREFHSVLVDTTRCVGCRTCEDSCAEQNKLPDPETGDDSVLEKSRDTSVSRFSVINRFNTSKGEIFAKKQCMHCNQPACVAACLVKAMYKTEGGPVIWRGDRCMGCRFCMISCPFDIPKFEFHSADPRIRKCIWCYDRLRKGEPPACVENCPEEALVMGQRRDLIREARKRIVNNPGRYVDHIYGEHEVGGTGWLYLSAVPFEQLGFDTGVGQRPVPELTRGFLYSVPFVFTLLPAFLLSLNNATRRKDSDSHAGGADEQAQ